MKKFFSALIALVMAVTMSAVAFAFPATGFSPSGIIAYDILPSGNAMTVCVLKDSDFNVGMSTAYMPAEYGASVYLQLLTGEDFVLDMIRNMKVKAEWEQGGDLVESVEVTVLRNYSGVYLPVVKIKLKDSTATAEADVIGTLTLNKSKGDAGYRIKDAEIPVSFPVSYLYNYNEFGEMLIDHDQQIVYPGDPHLLKFDYDDEVEFTFGSEPNEGTFTVDVSGQGKLLLLFDTMPNVAVEAANPTANMVFFGFNNVKFNRTGEFFYETETGKYIYQLIDGMPVEIAGAVYDEADEGFRFYTRTLGNYVISDIPLVAPDPEAAKAAVVDGIARYNPVTRRQFIV